MMLFENTWRFQGASAKAERALRGGPVFGDVHQAQLIHGIGRENMPDATALIGDGAEVIVDRGAGLLVVAAPLLPERAPPAVRRGDSPRGRIRHRFTSLAGLVREEPLPELGSSRCALNSALDRSASLTSLSATRSTNHR